jgi:hypothetical protein
MESEELNYTLEDEIQISNINSDYRNSNYKIINISLDGEVVKLKQDFKLGKGGIFWDGVKLYKDSLMSLLR